MSVSKTKPDGSQRVKDGYHWVVGGSIPPPSSHSTEGTGVTNPLVMSYRLQRESRLKTIRPPWRTGHPKGSQALVSQGGNGSGFGDASRPLWRDSSSNGKLLVQWAVALGKLYPSLTVVG